MTRVNSRTSSSRCSSWTISRAAYCPSASAALWPNSSSALGLQRTTWPSAFSTTAATPSRSSRPLGGAWEPVADRSSAAREECVVSIPHLPLPPGALTRAASAGVLSSSMVAPDRRGPHLGPPDGPSPSPGRPAPARLPPQLGRPPRPAPPVAAGPSHRCPRPGERSPGRRTPGAAGACRGTVPGRRAVPAVVARPGGPPSAVEPRGTAGAPERRRPGGRRRRSARAYR